jgi:HD-GYP domain-containing protein (c-di-GMP phosphodiesterase class II)
MPGKMNMLLRTFLSRTGHTGNSSHLSNLRHLGSSCMSTSNNLSPLPLNRKLNIQLQVRDFIFSTKHYPETQKQSSALPVMVKEKATPGGSPINTNVIEMKTMLLKTIVGESLFEESQQHGTANKTALNAQVETAVRNAATAIESVIRKSLREEWPDDDDAARFICLLIKAFNTFTFEHSERVIDLSVDLAREMGIDDEKQLKSIEEGARFHDLGEVELELQKASPDVRERISWYIGISDIRKCGFFHDIGKVKIPDSILNKPGRLTDEEFEIIKKHPVIGEQILSSIASLRDVLPVVRHHHERWDGKGYPDRLSGDNIPFEARIVSVADAYDAMVSDRPYRKGMSAEKAIEELEKCAGSQFDPLIVKAFMKVLKKRVRLL